MCVCVCVSVTYVQFHKNQGPDPARSNGWLRCLRRDAPATGMPWASLGSAWLDEGETTLSGRPVIQNHQAKSKPKDTKSHLNHHVFRCFRA